MPQLPSRTIVLTAVASVALVACSVPINTGLGAPAEDRSNGEREVASAPQVAQDRPTSAEPAPPIDSAKDDEADTYTRLGVAQTAKKNPTDALELHGKALALREEIYGPDHPRVAQSLNFMATSYYQLQRFDEAEAAFRRQIEIYTKSLGEGDRMTGLSLNNLAFFYAATGRYEEAEPLFKKSLKVLEKSEDTRSTELARALDNYAAMLMDAGRNGEAMKLQERTKDLRTNRNRIEDILKSTR